jgi:hypothetical protein
MLSVGSTGEVNVKTAKGDFDTERLGQRLNPVRLQHDIAKAGIGPGFAPRRILSTCYAPNYGSMFRRAAANVFMRIRLELKVASDGT